MGISHNQNNFSLPLPIPRSARALAEQFGREVSTPEKARQIQLNTIAVLVVEYYLQLMGIATDLTKSDSWNLPIRLMADTADLVLPKLGRLECRAIVDEVAYCTVPPETWHDRVGYIVVQIDDLLQTAWLLGFVPKVHSERLDLNQLQPPEALFEHLARLATQPAIVQLSQWYQGVFAAGWEAVDAVLSWSELGFAFRGEPITPQVSGSTQRAKRIDLGIQLSRSTDVVASLQFALVLELILMKNLESDICLKIYPNGQTMLPQNLYLIVEDEFGIILIEAQARSRDNCLQVRFKGETGERFKVLVALGSTSISEEFII